MKINNLLLDEIETLGLEQNTAITFCLCFVFKEYGCLDKALESGLLNYEEEKLCRIRLTQYNPETDTLELKIPLFYNEDVVEGYDDYYAYLVKSNKITTKARLVSNDETRKNFYELQSMYKDFDLERFKKATESYYSNEQYVKNLPKFIAELGKTYYDSYKEENDYIL